MILRSAKRDDVPAIVAMLADDPLGAVREDASDPLPHSYWDAFEAIDGDPNQVVLVADREGDVVGTLQMSFIPNLSRRGAWRAQIEGVRVSRSARGGGIGERMVLWCIERARERGCLLVQLTTDKQRPDAIRFYERLGFLASHEGMKLSL